MKERNFILFCPFPALIEHTSRTQFDSNKEVQIKAKTWYVLIMKKYKKSSKLIFIVQLLKIEMFMYIDGRKDTGVFSSLYYHNRYIWWRNKNIYTNQTVRTRDQFCETFVMIILKNLNQVKYIRTTVQSFIEFNYYFAWDYNLFDLFNMHLVSFCSLV